MSFRTLMQAAPAKANELFTKLADTSDGAVKTREKLFTELKAELELHSDLEEQHLFPVLRRNAETKELVAEAIKDNKELRAKLTELEALPKNDEAFPERLKELQKTFRQHARDEKRELLPAVQRALSEEQVQNVAGKIEASVAEAEKARHEDLEAQRAKARKEREEAVRQAERQAETERARQAAAEQARQEEAAQKRAKARHEREEAERQAEQTAAVRQAREEVKRRTQDAAEAVPHAAMVAQDFAFRVAKTAATSTQRVVEDFHSIVATLPKIAASAVTDIRSSWIEWVGQTTHMSQQLLVQAAEQQQQFAASAVQGWMGYNARIVQISMRVAQEGFRPLANRSPVTFDHQSSNRSLTR